MSILAVALWIHRSTQAPRKIFTQGVLLRSTRLIVVELRMCFPAVWLVPPRLIMVVLRMCFLVGLHVLYKSTQAVYKPLLQLVSHQMCQCTPGGFNPSQGPSIKQGF